MQQKIKKLNSIIHGEIERLFNQKISNIGTSRQALEQWINQLDKVPSARGKVLITALRNYTWIEWAVYCAAVIRKMGFESTLLFNKSEVLKLYKAPDFFNFWSGVTKIPGIELVNIEELHYDEQDYSRYYEISHSSSVAALAYDYHIESADVIDQPDKFSKELIKLKDKSAKNGARIKKYCEQNRFHVFLCYSGIIHDTRMILQGASDAKQETVCVEGWAWRPGHMIYNFNAPALEYNVKGWMNYLGKFDIEKDSEIKKYFNFLDGDEPSNAWLNNFYNVQKTKIATNFPSYIQNFINGNEKIFLLACNVIGDSSLLNRETIFESHKVFITETAIYFKNHSDLKLIIRAHPGEEWVKSKVKIRLGQFANKLTKGISNILVIDSDQKLNTFSLIPFVHTGLVWVSSAGVDLVARGVPVISAASPKYCNLGIVAEPKTKEEFFNLLELHSKNNLRPTKEQIEKAKEYLYLVFKGFSFEAYGRNFRATTCILNSMPSQEEHDRFYRILLKLEPAPDQTII